MSWDDNLISVATEMGTIELYSFKILEKISETKRT